MSEFVSEATKDLDVAAIQRSVIEEMPRPGERGGPIPSLDGSQFFWLLGNAIDDIVPWGRNYKMRDTQLRNLAVQENIFLSALGIICSRNSGFSWKIDGPKRPAGVIQDILENANQGAGWHDLIVKTTVDLSTQDNGAFWEIVRGGRGRVGDPLIGLNHLDSARCWHTGNRESPVFYLDRLGRHHLLNWWEVIEFAEMPTAIESLFGLQYCTLTRLLRKLQTLKNIETMAYEKSGGRWAKAIHMVKGITSQQMTDAMNKARSEADNAGLIRYMAPVVVGTLDPKADVGHDTIDLASVPDGYDPKTLFDQYINLVAMAFESDYQEFAPLPGGGLGSGAQSEMLHLKSRGKGPATFMKMIEHAINQRVIPRNMKFFFDEQDQEAELADAQIKAIRAQTRATRVASFEITPQVARQIANDEGDLPLEYIEMLSEQDLTPNVTIDNNFTAESQTERVRPRAAIPQPASNNPARQAQPAVVPPVRPPTPLGTKEIEEAEEEFTERLETLKSRLMDKVTQLEDDLEEALTTREREVKHNRFGLITKIIDRPGKKSA